MKRFISKNKFYSINCASVAFIWILLVFQSYAGIEYSDSGCLRNPLDLEDNDISSQMTSKEAILKSYLLPTDIDNPISDAKQRILHGDYRFIGLGTNPRDNTYPALDKSEYAYYLCKYGKRYIQGADQYYDNEAHAELIKKFWQYAQEYNQYLLDYVRNMK